DPPSQALLVELLLDAKASGTAVLLTTHQMAFADGVADRAIVLSEGELLDQGPWAAVRQRAAERGWLPGDACARRRRWRRGPDARPRHPSLSARRAGAA